MTLVTEEFLIHLCDFGLTDAPAASESKAQPSGLGVPQSAPSNFVSATATSAAIFVS